MPETKHSQENLAYIRTHVDNLERMVRFQISADPQSRQRIREAFQQRPGMAEVYLALSDGPRTQDDLKAQLKLSQPTISRIVKELYEAGLIRKVPSTDRRSAYAWGDLEDVLAVSKLAHALVSNGASNKKTRRKGAKSG